MSVTKPTNNEELIRNIMSYSEFGALAQIFVIDALTKQAEKIASMSIDELRESFGNESMIGPEAWHGVAKEIKGRMDKFYKRTR